MDKSPQKSLTYRKFDEKDIASSFNTFVAPNELDKEYSFIDKRTVKPQPKPQENVLDFLTKNFFQKGDKKPLMVFGDFGVGKTTFLQKLFVRVAQQYPEQDMTFVYCGKNTDDELRVILNKGNTILFLDGFDEDGKLKQDNHSVTYYGEENDSQRIEDRKNSRIVELNKILSEFYKVVISSRPSAFTANEVSLLSLGGKDMSVLTLNGFNEKNAETYLAKKFPRTLSNHYKAFFSKIPPQDDRTKALKIFKAKPEFFRKPLLLSFFKDLLGLDVAKVKEMYLYQIYEVIVEKCVEREAKIVETENPSQTSYDKEMQYNAKLFCYKMYDATQDILIDTITAKDLSQKWLTNFDKAQRHNKQNRSFLKREGDRWSFTHQSLRDYFVAMLLFEQSIKVKNSDTGKENTLYLYEENPKTGEKISLLLNYPEIINFYKEMLWHKIAKRKKPITLYSPPDKNWQIESYLFTSDFKHFKDLRLEEAKYTFKVVEKLKEFGIKHYFTAYYDQYQECLDTYSMLVERNYIVERFLREVYQLLNEKLKLKGEHKDIWKLKALIELNLIDKGLQALPSEIGQLKNLQKLYLGKNQLIELPEAIGQLKNLKILLLWDNQLTKLPESIGRLHHLQIVNLSSNKFNTLPISIVQQRNLKKLYLSYNQLIELPKSITRLESLQKLHLRGNNFLTHERQEIRQLLPNCDIRF